ncbi:MAG: PhzF family phenazine biosynthesis protein, partial [Chloroflexota bacterium]
LIGLLASLDGRTNGEVRVWSGQGFEMGRPSILDLEADLGGGEVTAVRVGGQSVLMMRGELRLGE